MIKQDLRLFFASFFITLLLAGWLAAFLIVDDTGSRYESKSTAALSVVRADSLSYRVDFMGQEYMVPLEKLNEAEAWRKKYACLVTPRPILTAERTYALAVYGWRKLNKSYREYEYQQAVAKSEQPAAP